MNDDLAPEMTKAGLQIVGSRRNTLLSLDFAGHARQNVAAFTD
jgi:hypothetical protein